MKLSIDLNCVRRHFGEKEALRIIKEVGFDSVDYSYFYLSDVEHEMILGEGHLSHAKEIRCYLDELGLTCNQAHAPFTMTPENCGFDESNSYFREIVRAMESAAVLGADCIVVHPLRPQPDKTIFEINHEMYKSLEPYAKKFGIRIAIENLFGMSADAQGKKYHRFERPELMTEMLGSLSEDSFVCCLDVGHALLTGIQPGDYVRGMDKRTLKALHIHDNGGETDDHTLPTLGKIDWEALTSALDEIGYDGAITFELTGFFKNMPKEVVIDALRLVVSMGHCMAEKISLMS